MDNEGDENNRNIAPLLTVTVPEQMLGAYNLNHPDVQALGLEDSPVLIVNPFDGESKPNDNIGYIAHLRIRSGRNMRKPDVCVQGEAGISKDIVVTLVCIL